MHILKIVSCSQQYKSLDFSKLEYTMLISSKNVSKYSHVAKSGSNDFPTNFQDMHKSVKIYNFLYSSNITKNIYCPLLQ